MKYPKPKSKSEIRSPKSEVAGDGNCCSEESGFWFWRQEAATEQMILREDATPARKPPPDLEERAAEFGEAIVRFARKVPRGPAAHRLMDQLVGAGTSVDANCSEAKDAVARKDFSETQ